MILRAIIRNRLLAQCALSTVEGATVHDVPHLRQSPCTCLDDRRFELVRVWALTNCPLMARKLTQGRLVAGVRCLMSVMEYAALRTVIPGEWWLHIQLHFSLTSLHSSASIFPEPSLLSH